MPKADASLAHTHQNSLYPFLMVSLLIIRRQIGVLHHCCVQIISMLKSIDLIGLEQVKIDWNKTLLHGELFPQPLNKDFSVIFEHWKVENI